MMMIELMMIKRMRVWWVMFRLGWLVGWRMRFWEGFLVGF